MPDKSNKTNNVCTQNGAVYDSQSKNAISKPMQTQPTKTISHIIQKLISSSPTFLLSYLPDTHNASKAMLFR